MKILIVEDEPEMMENMAEALGQEHHIVEKAPDFETAKMKVGVYKYDCILLDITLPDGDGFTLLKTIKDTENHAGVIIVSAKDSLDDKIHGLEIGADDYLTKPFHLAELNARVNAILRRRRFKGNNSIKINNLEIFPDKRLVLVNDIELQLYRKEFDILLYMAVNKNRLVRKTSLAEHVWGDFIDESDDFDFVYSQIKNLRRKLREAGSALEIKSVYGVGYKLVK